MLQCVALPQPARPDSAGSPASEDISWPANTEIDAADANEETPKHRNQKEIRFDAISCSSRDTATHSDRPSGLGVARDTGWTEERQKDERDLGSAAVGRACDAVRPVSSVRFSDSQAACRRCRSHTAATIKSHAGGEYRTYGRSFEPTTRWGISGANWNENVRQGSFAIRGKILGSEILWHALFAAPPDLVLRQGMLTVSIGWA